MSRINLCSKVSPLAASLAFAFLAAVPAASYSASATVSIISPSTLTSSGISPNSPLLTDTQGNLYGSLEFGDTSTSYGSLFSLAPNGSVTTIHGFDTAQGAPEGAMVRTDDGTIYGVTMDVTNGQGFYGSGSIFSLAPDGTYSVLHDFSPAGSANTDGVDPLGLTLGSDGALYGATQSGGSGNAGTIFRITTTGQFSVLYAFNPQSNAGTSPCPVILSSDGNLYGTTNAGEVTVFRLTLQGKLTTLHRFVGKQAVGNCASVIQGSDGNFYGTTFEGSASGLQDKGGTIYKMTPSGKVTFLHTFSSGDPNSDGAFPVGLIQAKDGNLYGVTQIGGEAGAGSLFQMTTSGTFTNLYSFPTTAFGYPIANLVQGIDGALYGTTNGFTIEFGSEIFAPTVFKAVINP